ncbi:MAG: serine phosphatase RsbU, regulator of sigma subunit [Capsulimonas sp.]|jgi:PAS domain S-box-containing protein|nr:serine phosphatase RsbU, regulator of sigma subunit [Capsulimonas sp.]
MTSPEPPDPRLLGKWEHDLPQIEAIIDSLAEGMVIADTSGRLLAANQAYVRLVGFARHEDLRQSLTDLPQWFEVRDLSGKVLPLDQWPLARALAGETFTDLQLELRRLDGTAAFIGSYNGSMAADGDGAPALAVLTVRDITAQKQTEAALETAYQHEKLLNEIGQAIRLTLDPREVQTVASRSLGQALLADRCYFAQIDFAAQRIWIAEEWRRDDLFPISGDYPLSDFGVDFRHIFDGNRTLIASDTRLYPWPKETVAVMEQHAVRALLNVPFFDDGSLVALLGVAMADGPHEWTEAEIGLTEAVAMQTRTAVEAVRISRREHNIAIALQQTLQPKMPAGMPGLQVSDFYRAALAEAEIGGDFCDLFSPEGDNTILVIGDVSGKGLAAATQVAAVRNMLRCVIYQGFPLAEAVAQLNQILTTQNLLSGFVTMCVAQYSPADHTFTYVSCGHEPVLLRHAATGHIELLGPTGPPLGVEGTAEYTHEARRLQAGDALLLYTDGLSESGPSRQDMLGVDGLANLLRAHPLHEDAHGLCQRIIAGVERHARGDLRDDACILTVRVL